MEFKVAKADLKKGTGVAVFPIFDDCKDIGYLKSLAKDVGVQAKLKITKFFQGKVGQITDLSLPKGMKYDYLFFVGLGKKSDLNMEKARTAGAKLASAINSMERSTATVYIHDELCQKTLCHVGIACGMAQGAHQKVYKFNALFHDKAEKHKVHLKGLEFVCNDGDKELKKHLGDISKVGDGVDLTRDLVSMPPNLLNPHTFAAECKNLAKLGVKVTVLDKKKLTALGMNALLGVCQGSAFEPKVAIMEWTGNSAKKSEKYAFVGKGVTFDSGGLSLKPAASMEDMKYDMGGAGVVTGLIKALAGRKAKVNAVGVVGLVENMPSGTAQRPGDVVKAMSGHTIEILNTDAEGRLVLADILWYTQKNYKPKFMINLATLTGAMVIALGENNYAGIFSNSDKLSEMLTDAGLSSGEKVWRLPMDDYYDSLIDSQIADVKNIGSRGAGSITAAQFLQRFVNKTPWAHIDIAGVTWDKTGTRLNSTGATGWGVKLLNELVKKNFEK